MRYVEVRVAQPLPPATFCLPSAASVTKTSCLRLRQGPLCICPIKRHDVIKHGDSGSLLKTWLHCLVPVGNTCKQIQQHRISSAQSCTFHNSSTYLSPMEGISVTRFDKNAGDSLAGSLICTVPRKFMSCEERYRCSFTQSTCARQLIQANKTSHAAYAYLSTYQPTCTHTTHYLPYKTNLNARFIACPPILSWACLACCWPRTRHAHL